MKVMKRGILAFALALALPALAARAQTKRPLTHDDYDRWNGIANQSLSSDGKWLMYRITHRNDDPAALTIKSLDSDRVHEIPRATSPQFTRNSRWALYIMPPPPREEGQEQPAESERPQSALKILDLTTGETQSIERVRAYTLPSDSTDYFSYTPIPRPTETAEEEGEQPAAGQRGRRGRGAQPAAGQRGGRGARGQRGGGGGARKSDGDELVIRSLQSGREIRLTHVGNSSFSDNNSRLFYTLTHAAGGENEADDGVYILDIGSGGKTTIAKGAGNYSSPTIDDAERQMVFTSDRADYGEDDAERKLYYWHEGMEEAVVLIEDATAGIPEGWEFAEGSGVGFSDSGGRLTLSTRPVREEVEQLPEAERIDVDIWHWLDAQIQPTQLQRINQDRNRTYDAVMHLAPQGGSRLVQLGRLDMPGVSIGVGGDADIGIGTSSDRYGIENTWESPGLQDVYFVNLETGERELFMERVQGVNLSLSPNGKYFTWFDRVKQTWFVKDRETEKVLDLKDAIPTALHDETHDSPSLAGAYGSPGWTDDDAAFLVYDSHDIWAVDPKGFWPARTITEGVGRRDDIQFRMSGGRGGRGGRGGGPRRTIDPTEPVLLSARHEATKDQGYYRDRVQGDSRPEKLIMAPKSFSTPNKADDADVQLFTRSSFDEFADLWVSDTNFRSMRKMTDANPQQKEFTWGTAELVKWTSSNGDPLQGILYKPEGFDAAKKYPMMVYFYETNANSLHRYVTPSAGGSSINYAFYVSRGYLLFVPDIIYRIGYPGQSAMHCVMPGIGSLIDKGFVDEKRIGVQGHSWGGYQIAYMVTQTDIFAAAEAGAPVSNMFSAYGGIRWASGVNRAFQYERTQSRIGGSIWDYPLRFLENSPIFYADKVDTPLLMLHNDEDGAVPWYQGIEYYIALRRNGRPVWMLNYNGEAHGLRQAKNQRDWTIRMQQFFDHYLKDEPAPVWLAEGVPATMKGRTLGLEPAENKDKNGGPGGERE